MEANRRFPHQIKVVRELVDQSTYPFTFYRQTVLESPCRVYPNRMGGTSPAAGAVVSDFVVSMPLHGVAIETNDLVEVQDRTRTIKGTVLSSYFGNIGVNLWINEVKN